MSSVRLAVYSGSSLIGGAERSLRQLLETLEPRFDVTVLGTARPVLEWLGAARPQAQLIELRHEGGKWAARAGLTHIRTLTELAPQVLHVSLHHPFACQWAIVGGLLARGTAVVAVEHSVSAPANRRQAGGKRLLSRGLAAHVAVSAWAARELERLIGLGAGSVRAIPNGVKTTTVEPTLRPGSDPVLAASGRFGREKGFDVLLKSLALIPETSLILIGDGPERAELELLARDLGLAERVRFTGWVDEPRELVAGADLFVTPSRAEAFGLATLEAMEAGLPVVATNVGGIPELIGDGDSGVLVDPERPAVLARAIVELLRDEPRRRELGRRARLRARQHFSAATTARSFADLYAGLAPPLAVLTGEEPQVASDDRPSVPRRPLT